MENLKVYDKKDNIVIRKLKKALAIAALSIATLTACVSNKNNSTQKEPTGIETITPTDTIDPTETVTPTTGITPTEEVMPTVTATPTPTPALTHKTVQEVADELKNVKVSVDELMNENVVYPTYFGAVDDNLTNEFIKHASYFESFGIMDFTHAKALVAKLNYCYLNSDAVDKEKAEEYLSILAKYDDVEIRRLYDAITEYNVEHPDEQIVPSWGMIDPNDKVGRAVINDRQQKITKLLINKEPFYDEFISNENYDVTVVKTDGSKIQLTGSYDDLNIAVKYADSTIQYCSNMLMTDRIGYSEQIHDARRHISNCRDSIIPAFSDPEHANVRRHGFDATDYYEEDLNKTASYK